MKPASIKTPIHTLLCLVFWASLQQACKKENTDTGCNARYTTDIKSIVNNRCAIAGCHDGSTSLADYRTYQGLKAKADNGRIRQMVFELGIMPPANAAQLTAGEKELLKCWLDNGAPEH